MERGNRQVYMDGRPGSPGDGAGLLAATPNGVYVDCGLLYSKMEHSAHGVCAECASFFGCAFASLLNETR